MAQTTVSPECVSSFCKQVHRRRYGGHVGTGPDHIKSIGDPWPLFATKQSRNKSIKSKIMSKTSSATLSFVNVSPEERLAAFRSSFNPPLPAGKVDNLYHVLLTVTHLQKDVNSEVQKVQVCGTYTSLEAAKAAAHRCLFEAGYEQEWFTDYETQPEEFRAHNIKRRSGLAVLATSPDGTIFRVSVATTPNVHQYQGGDDGKVHKELYHVVQSNVLYSEDDSGEARDTNVEGSFESYEEAREFASQVLLSEADGITKDTFAQYDEAQPNEKDCGFGESVVVHAVGQNGENVLVSVLKGQEMEAVRLAEAARRLRE